MNALFLSVAYSLTVVIWYLHTGVTKKKKKKIPHRPRFVAWELIPFTAL